jgi:dihydrofolate reductase
MSGDQQRRLILHMSVSLDGFVGHKDGTIDWMTPPDGPDHSAARHHANLEMIGQAGLIVVGRVAYEQMAPAWSSSDSPMAQLINRLPKVVFSNSLDEVEWENARLNEAPLEQEIPRLKGEAGGDIVVFGGGHIGHSLIRHRLADELRLTVHPVALGDGISLMHGLPEPQRFELVSDTVYTDGSVLQVLRPDRVRPVEVNR